MVSSKAQRRRASQEKVAAMRAAQERAARRGRLAIVAAVMAGVLVVVGGIVAISVARDDSGTAAQQSSELPAGVLQAVTSVPAGVLDQIGKGSAISPPVAASGEALSVTQNGTVKPQVLYIGAEFCPYCAGERWAMVVALSRFGTFSNLGATTSAADDVYPNTPTFTFHGASYNSEYLAFVGKELNTNEREGDGYAPLDELTAAEEAEFTKLTEGQRSFPFVDLAGRYVIRGGQFDMDVLQGKSMQEIAGVLKDPEDPISQAINGSANTITAALCELTNGEPANVCDSTAISSLRGQLRAG